MNATELKSDRSAEPQIAIEALGLSIESTFVPFSQSRNRTEKSPSLNWRVTLVRTVNGLKREVLATDYGAGCGHAPSYKQSWGKRSLADQDRDAMVAWECENGRPAHKFVNVRVRATGPATLVPDTLNVIHSLVMDSDVLDAGGFESWASDLGYDTDSRKAEEIYKACLDIALKLRAAVGDSGLQALRAAFQDY